MSPPRKVQSIARGPQSFTPSALRPIQSPMQPMAPNSPMAQQIANLPPQFQTPAEPVYSVEEDIQDLAMEIYAKLAIDSIQGHGQSHEDTLRQLASYAKTAARIFFEDPSEKV